MTSVEDNARSKELLLATIDQKIELYMDYDFPEIGSGTLGAMKQNRNRIAKLLKLPTRNFNQRSTIKEK